jgi:3-hydroxyisobutyrate dehydrogenase-like beta-hydroxyacid dehydrogenase
MHIGFIGLGRMGFPMARNLLDAGYSLSVYNRTQSKAAPLLDAGARLASSPLDAITPGQLVVTMISDDAALAEVASDEWLQHLGNSGIHLSMSTVSASIARQLATRHENHGSVYLAAPVFGPPAAAAARKLWICLSGDAAAKERVRPVLEAMSQGIYDFGTEAGAAHIAKLAGNFILQSALEAISEGVTLTEKNGMDSSAFVSMLTQTIFNCPVYQNYGGKIAGRRFNEVTFSFATAAKDNRLIRQAAEEAGIALPLADLANQRFRAGLARGRAEMDMTAIALGAAEDAGL